ncbi:hypothetical protein MJO29_013241 [Puccinia striiformis f. sp. tritici]|nr:hypothetical protein MJO29_013241 [Puccinia striiformis f. sp. tritici]
MFPTATIKSSRLWATIRTWHLTENMRINVSGLSEEENEGNREFGSSLLALGEGIGQVEDYHVVKIPSLNLISSNDEDRANDTLIDFVYEKLSLDAQRNPENDTDYLTKRCILAPLNADVRKLNSQVLSRIRGASSKSKSIDVPDPDGLASLPEEVLNKLSIPNFPEHELELKLGMPVVVLRNLYIKKGVCNGTRMVLTYVGMGSVEGKLVSGPFRGETIMIPKIKLHHKGSMKSGLSFFRHQFPLAPAYAMSINKSQGQTLSCVGIMLKNSCFAHGQLYVALSRVTEKKNLMVCKVDKKDGLINVVHQSIFSKSCEKPEGFGLDHSSNRSSAE